MEVAGVDVPESLVRQWRKWLAPSVQPFFVDADLVRDVPPGREESLTPELRDTFAFWKVDKSLTAVWLDEATFGALPKPTRARLVRAQVQCGRSAVPTVRAWNDVLPIDVVRSQADGHRFVWWPSLLEIGGDVVLQRAVTSLASLTSPSRHHDVAESTWHRGAGAVPAARRLAGSFPASSGANCFGTVMAACGVPHVADQWMLQQPFDDWLGSTARRLSRRRARDGDDDRRPGTVFVWRVDSGLPVHAAVTLGDGWAFEKPSQCWYTPRLVGRADEIVRANRAVGSRLERWTVGRAGR